MDPWRYLPEELRPPGSGDLTTLHWRADLGPGALVGEVGRHLIDLQKVIDLGQRWGLHFAEGAAVHSAAQEFQEREQDLAAEISEQWELGYSDSKDLLREIQYPREARLPLRLDVPEILQTVLTPNAYELLGRPAFATSISYENPVDVAVSGAGFGFKGIISLLVLIRDWSTTRRLRAAEAAQAEARIDREQAEAQLAISRADLAKWYVNEVQQGRAQYVPPGQLASEAKDSELKAIDRLSQTDPQLELPPGAEGWADNSSPEVAGASWTG